MKGTLKGSIAAAEKSIFPHIVGACRMTKMLFLGKADSAATRKIPKVCSRRSSQCLDLPFSSHSDQIRPVT